MCSLAFTIVSNEEDGSDITRGQFLQAIQKRLNTLVDDADVHEAILPPEDTYMETITQEEFRKNAEQCPNCQSSDIYGTGWDCRENRVFQNRECNICDVTWTVCFEAKSFLRHDE
jgi:hypothetical protein